MSGRQLQEDPLLIRGTQESGRRGVVGGDRGLVPWLQWKPLEDQAEGDRTERSLGSQTCLSCCLLVQALL